MFLKGNEEVDKGDRQQSKYLFSIINYWPQSPLGRMEGFDPGGKVIYGILFSLSNNVVEK